MLTVVSAAAGVLAWQAEAEQAADPTSVAAGRLDAGATDSCTVLPDGSVRCWGFGFDGELGYGNTDNVGAGDTPGSVGPLDLGAGRTAVAISAGDYHTCAVLDDGTVRCWGFGGDGRLGYGNTNAIGTTSATTPASAGPVKLGAGRTATAIAAGGAHTCAVLDNGTVRCWGFGFNGQLGYGNMNRIGDNETPDSVGPVDLGAGELATAITAGSAHTCALLQDGGVLCWGLGSNGQLGYGNTNNVGDSQTPGSVKPVDLGPGHTAKAISAGDFHTCAILDDGSVRCWGFNGDGELGYGNTETIGDDETPGSVAPVDLGLGHTAVAISAGGRHTCAILDDGTVRCWGDGAYGQLGYGNTSNVGDDETPASAGPVDLGPGRTAVAISAGGNHTCALLDNGNVLCWGDGASGRLGYCSESNVGDSQTPGSAGPVNLQPSDGGARCPVPVNTSPPSVSGRAVLGQRLSESHGSWSGSPTGYGYQWQRCDGAGADCAAIAGAAGQSYTLTTADVDHTIRVVETASNAGGAGAPASSPQTAPVTGVPIDDSPPTIKGQPVEGQVLSEAHGSWSAGPTGYAYQWQRCGRTGSGCVAITGATGHSYTLRGSDIAHTVRVRESASNGAGAGAPASSAPSGLVTVSDAVRARGLRSCLAAAGGHGRRGCLRRYGRTPGRVGALKARTLGSTRIELAFTAAGTDGNHAPPARSYLIKESLAPIRDRRDFTQAGALCREACRVPVTKVDTEITLTITNLKPNTTYYYAIAALDNVTGRAGPRSQAVKAKTASAPR